ncbi:MAG: hypothetical protein HZC51_13305 [Nitrospirae bacterium]|nr:hypothetical protein [Nitrospirota bacterium]
MEAVAVALLLVVLAEIIASARWSASYFRSGIPLFSKSISVRVFDGVLPEDEAMTEKFKGGTFGQSLVFKSISETEVAFREKAFEFTFFNSTPVMHGLLSLTPGRRGIEVVGRLNWSILGFALIFIVQFGRMHDEMLIIFLPAFVGMMLLLYYIQYRRFNRVAGYLREKYEGTPSPQPLSREERG